MESTVRRPLPTSTSVPTIVLTIWWQKADAETSNSNRAIPESPGSSHRQDAPVTRRTRVGIVPSGRSVGRRQNEVKSCRPTSSAAAALHGIHIESSRDVPRQRGGERIGIRTVQDPVPVGTADGAEAGVEVVRSPVQHRDHHRRAALPVHRSTESDQIGFIGYVEADYLAHGVDSAVGPACTDHRDRDLQGTRERGVKTGGNRGNAEVGCETVKGSSVVGDDSPNPHYGRDQTSSMRAIGALSPVRGPSFRIRV